MKLKNESPSDSSLLKMLNRFVDKIDRVIIKTENLKSNRLELGAFVLYCLLQIVMIFFHEPWFDEAQAWNIARDGSLKEILFEIPHYEGHPALWHLILKPFAQMGLGFNVTISLINIVFIATTVGLILFKSPFPRIIRLILPFTYFLGYQYSVVSRPYSVMFLAFMVLAITYKNRNLKPLKYILSLIFLCATSAYGVVFAGGLAMVWVFEIFRQDGLTKMFTDKRCWLLGVLLAYAVFILVRIIPYEDTWAVAAVESNFGLIMIFRLIYMFFALPSDLFFTSTYTSDYLSAFPPLELLGDSLIGIIILSFIIICARKKKKVLTFVIPYVLFALFGSVVYIYVHHTGIMLMFIIFWWWIYLEDNEEQLQVDMQAVIKHDIIRILAVIFATAGMCIPVIWTITSCVVDICTEYQFGKNEAEFLAEHNLTDNSIVFNWGITFDEENEIIDYDLKHIGKMVNMSPYGVLNNCPNWPFDNSLYTFYHKNVTLAEKKAITDSLLNNIVPDVLVGEPRWDSLLLDNEDAVLDDSLFIQTYAMVYNADIYKIWKMTPLRSRARIYVKRSLLEEKKLTEISYLPDKAVEKD